MKFDKSRVYTAVNADELKVGSKIFVADTLDGIKHEVESNNFEPCRLEEINNESCQFRFVSGGTFYALAYLVSEPAKLKWTDLDVGDVIRHGPITAMVTVIDSGEDEYHIFAFRWLDDEELAEWEKIENENDN